MGRDIKKVAIMILFIMLTVSFAEASSLGSGPAGALIQSLKNTMRDKYVLGGEYTLEIKSEGQGIVSYSPKKASYSHGDIVILTAVSNPGWKFSRWEGHLAGSEHGIC